MPLTRDEVLDMAEAMQKYGGSFVKALGAAFLYADASNCEKLERAFPQFVAEYARVANRIKMEAP